MLNLRKMPLLTLAITIALTMGGCAQKPVNVPAGHAFYGETSDKGVHIIQGQTPNAIFATEKDCEANIDFGAPRHYKVDAPLQTIPAQAQPQSPLVNNRNQMPLSPGDMVELMIEKGDGFNGRYVINNAGYINIPLILPIKATGLTLKAVSDKIELALIKQRIFQPNTAMVSLHLLHLAAVEVAVAGAVFQPGRVLINAKAANRVLDEQLAANGDYSHTRLLSEAVRAAAGVRPDAKLDQVILIRQGWKVEVDLSGILTGDLVTDYPVIDGDRVIVPTTGCFQSHLVRPSQITPKGFRVFMSNLTSPTNSNSNSGIGRFTNNIPYGTQLLQAAISANCVGGSPLSNASRKILLASKHPITGKTQVIERALEDLMRFPNRDELNPYLMPNDSIACYDSTLSDIRSLANTLSDIFRPFVGL